MTSKKQLRYAEILAHVNALNDAGIYPTVKKIFEQFFTNPVIIHTIRTDLKNLVKDGQLSMRKIKGSFQFNIIRINVVKRQDSSCHQVLCDACKREINASRTISRVFCYYCKREMKVEKRYYRKICCDDCRKELKKWRREKRQTNQN